MSRESTSIKQLDFEFLDMGDGDSCRAVQRTAAEDSPSSVMTMTRRTSTPSPEVELLNLISCIFPAKICLVSSDIMPVCTRDIIIMIVL